MNNFLIIRLSSLGDIVHTLPAFAGLRKHFPEARIDWLVEEKGKEILDFVPGLNEVVVLASKKWPLFSRNFWRETCCAVKAIRNRNRVVLDFQGLVKSGLFAYLSRAKTRIGFHKTNLREPGASVFYTENLAPISERNHVIQKNLALLTRIGIQEEVFDFPLNIPKELSQEVLSRLKNCGYDGNRGLILLNVGAAWETKRWFAPAWIDLIRKLKAQRPDFFYLLLWGTDQEKELADRIQTETGTASAPSLSLKEVIALVNHTVLLVSGDTFALQMACALSRPVVGLFGPTNPDRNGPFKPEDRVAFHEMECSHCYKRKCASLECLERISPEEVLSLCLKTLNSNA